MPLQSLTRHPAARLALAAALIVLLGTIIPGVMDRNASHLALGKEFTATSISSDNRLRIVRTTRTSETDVDSVAAANTTIIVTFDGKDVANLHDSAELNRESTYPQDASTQSCDGLSYFFPAQTEQRSYLYCDPLRQEAQPVDYAGKTNFDGMNAYVFRQKLAPAPIPAQAGSTLTAPSDAQYGVSREITVDPLSGTILNVDESITLSSAAGTYSTDLSWDEASRAAANSTATSANKQHVGLVATTWVTRVLALALVAWAVFKRGGGHKREHKRRQGNRS